MFKFFQRGRTDPAGDNAALIEQQPSEIRSPIADVEYVGGTAVATLTITDLCTGSGVEQLADLLYEMLCVLPKSEAHRRATLENRTEIERIF